MRRFLAEPQGIHLANHHQPQIGIKGELCLVEKAIRACTAGLARRVETHASFADPYQQCANTRGERTSGMGNPCTWLQHEARNTANRDVRTNTALVHNDEGTIEHIELALLNVEDS